MDQLSADWGGQVACLDFYELQDFPSNKCVTVPKQKNRIRTTELLGEKGKEETRERKKTTTEHQLKNIKRVIYISLDLMNNNLLLGNSSTRRSRVCCRCCAPQYCAVRLHHFHHFAKKIQIFKEYKKKKVCKKKIFWNFFVSMVCASIKKCHQHTSSCLKHLKIWFRLVNQLYTHQACAPSFGGKRENWVFTMRKGLTPKKRCH